MLLLQSHTSWLLSIGDEGREYCPLGYIDLVLDTILTSTDMSEGMKALPGSPYIE